MYILELSSRIVCPVHIYLRVNNSGDKLEDTSTVMNHNHAVSQVRSTVYNKMDV